MKDMANIVAVFAHPDDESFSSGGTLARFAHEGARVILLCATDGRQGGKGLNRKLLPSRMKTIRKRELLQSAKLLRIAKVICWHYHDKELAHASQGFITKRLIRVFKRYKPDLVLTFGFDGFSGHSDHIAISRFTTSAFHKWQGKELSRLWHTSWNPRAGVNFKVPKSLKPHRANIIVRIAGHGVTKLRAIHAHQSQVFSRARIGENGEKVPRIFFKEEAYYQVFPVLRTLKKI